MNNTNIINNTIVFPKENTTRLQTVLSIKGFYNMYPAFNLSMPIDTINKYIDELYKGTNKLQNIKPELLPVNALSEFNQDARAYYGNYISTNTSDNMIRGRKTLDVLKTSDLYKLKYLHYKYKYNLLKNKNIQN